MICLKFIILSTLLLVPHLDAKKIKCKPICPDCKYDRNETFLTNMLKYFNGEIPAPADGVCQSGIKWINHGPDFGEKNDACCCLQVLPTQSLDCTTAGAVQCPLIPFIGYTEVIKDYGLRLRKLLKDAPSNGCCPADSIKYFIPYDLLKIVGGVCTCVPKYKIADRNVIL